MPPFTPAILALEDGTIFRGRAFGAAVDGAGEVVFNTSMSGYPEILTDPSYRGQMVCMTYPLIGNYGITPEDFESRKIFLGGFIVREKSRLASNWRSNYSLDEFLKKEGIPGIEGIDTRRLVKHIREAGAMKGVISTTETNTDDLVDRARAQVDITGRDLVKEVTTSAAYEWTTPLYDDKQADDQGGKGNKANSEYNIVAVDYGIKLNILRGLVSHGCRVRVVPATTSAAEILAHNPDGVFLSNGPGDPAALPQLVDTVKNLLGKKPLFGICLGHQILAQALGGTTFKLKFGHHGGNQPVMRLDTRQVEITAQNHGFCVDLDSIKDHPVTMTHLNLNDQTLEGFAHQEIPAFGVQYHPESAPGPHDSRYLFGCFTEMIRTGSAVGISTANAK